MSGLARSAQSDLPDRIEVLISIEDIVVQQAALHVEKRRLWFPNDLMSADAKMDAAADSELLRIRDAARGLSDTVRVAVALNLLTEEGLPHFHRLIATYLGNSGPWRPWQTRKKERRVGTRGVRTCRYRWAPVH